LLLKDGENGRSGGNIGLWKRRRQTRWKFARCGVIVRSSNTRPIQYVVSWYIMYHRTRISSTPFCDFLYGFQGIGALYSFDLWLTSWADECPVGKLDHISSRRTSCGFLIVVCPICALNNVSFTR